MWCECVQKRESVVCWVCGVWCVCCVGVCESVCLCCVVYVCG